MPIMQLNVHDRNRFHECMAAPACPRTFIGCVMELMDKYGSEGTVLDLGRDPAPLTMGFTVRECVSRNKQMSGVIHYDSARQTFGIHT